jgi:plastocyanin
MVRWTNTTTNDDPRTVTRDAGVNNGPNSGILDKGETYTFTFNTVGSFPYHSGFADMHGTVTVTN